MAESPKNRLLRGFRLRSIFDFCNKIGTFRTSRDVSRISAFRGKSEVSIALPG